MYRRGPLDTHEGAAVPGSLKARFAAVRVRTADGPPQRIWDKGQQHPRDEAWLIGEHRASGEKKYYLANLAAGMDLRSLAATIKARWIVRAGPSTVEGGTRARPLRGKVLARPSSSCADGDDCLRVPPTSPAQKSEAGKKESTARPSTDVAGGSPRHRRPHHAIKSSAISVLPILDQRGKAALSKSTKVVLVPSRALS